MVNPNEDYYGWTQETAEKLRQGKFSEVNMEDLVEELEDMGKSELRALESHLIVLLMHLLKWQYQPDRRGKSWRLTIKDQRVAIKKVLKSNPSLKPKLDETGQDAYLRAVINAAKETDKEEEDFPTAFESAGWTWEQVLDMEFYPD